MNPYQFDPNVQGPSFMPMEGGMILGPAGRQPTLPGVIVRFLLACALAALVILLVISGWLTWELNISGWSLLTDANGDVVSDWQGVAVVTTAATGVLWLLTLLRSNRTTRFLLVLPLILGSLGALLEAVHPQDGQQWPGAGFGIAVICFPAALVIALIRSFLPRIQRGGMRVVLGQIGRPIALAGLAVALVFGGVLGYASYWWGVQRPVDASTAAAGGVPAVGGAAGSTLWQVSGPLTPYGADAPTDSLASAVLAGGLVAIEHGPAGDIAVVDAASGAPRWHFNRPGATLSYLSASADGRTLVAYYLARQRTVTIGFDAATGSVRWQQFSGWEDDSEVTALPNAIVSIGYDDHGTATAVDPASGKQLWSVAQLWDEDDDSTCPAEDSSVAGADSLSGLTVVLAECIDPGRLEVRAIDSTGRVRWRLPDLIGPRDSSDQATVLAVSSSVVLIDTGVNHQIDALDPTTGRVLWSMNGGSEKFVALDDSFVLTATGPDNKGRFHVRSATTGALTAAQPPAGLVPPDEASAAGSVLSGRAYLLVENPDATGSLAVLDLRTGKVVGSYPVSLEPVAGLTFAAYLPGTASPGGGVVMVTGVTGGSQGIDRLTSLAVRVPGS
jgi:outer membrane protein assembly factor BamB